MERMKTAIVTGASGGIGKAIVQAFLDRGYNVVANSLKLLHDEFQPDAKSRTRQRGHRR